MSLASELINRIEDLENSYVDEAAPRRTVSFAGGQRHTKLKCPPGYKLVNNTCQREKTSEILARRRGAKKSARTRRSHQSQTNRKRALTLRRRHSAGL